MKIGIVNIGDELLGGKILNTNQWDLARMLAPLGHDLPFSMVIGDDLEAFALTLQWALSDDGGKDGARYSGTEATLIGKSGSRKLDVLVLTGGLGPTRDDLTRQAAADFLGRKVVESSEALEWLCAFLKKDAADLPWGQRVQACVPEDTQALRNPEGTACGFAFTANGVRVFAFPGVPRELDAMARMHLLPYLPQDRFLLEKTLWTYGWSEGAQRQALETLALPEPFKFSSLPNEKGVRISLNCLAAAVERHDREKELDAHWSALQAAIPPESLVSAQGLTLPQAVVQLLKDRHATVSVAESCTGGGLGALITEVAGSSEVFRQGFITYSNQSKTERLNVDSKLLESHGAVSEPVVKAMVLGCLEACGSDYACAITGIAGPTGGSAEKPVGTVWIAVAVQRAGLDPLIHAQRFQFRGDRAMVRSRSAYTTLNQLRLLILGQLSGK